MKKEYLKLPLQEALLETAVDKELERMVAGRKFGWLRKKALRWLIKYQAKHQVQSK